MLTIGTIARRAGVGVQTMRFYEREGLLEAPPRTSAGYRMYDESAIERVQFIRRAQQLGFALREIRELLALQTDDLAPCAEVRSAVTAKLDDIEQRIAELTRIRTALLGLVETCAGDGPACRCVIIDGIAVGEKTDGV